MADDYLLKTYFNSIKNYKALDNDEEIRLILEAQKGNVQSRDKVVNANLKFVVKIAKEFLDKGLSLMDLISEGNLGLIEAVDRFDAKEGTKFITYAVWWIRQHIVKALQDKARLIRLPINRNNELVRLNKEIDRYRSENIPLDVDEISKKLGMSKENIYILMQTSSACVSLDQEIDGDGNSSFTLADTIESNYALPDVELEEAEEKTELFKAIDKLPERERVIICMRYGIGEYTNMSLQDIGEFMNLTKERVRQLEKKALDTMRLSLAG